MRPASRSLVQAIHQVHSAAEAVDLGLEYPWNYGLLRHLLIKLEQHPNQSIEMRHAQARGVHALAKVARQLGHDASLVSGHYCRAFHLHASLGETASAFSAILGQVLTLRLDQRYEAWHVLEKARQFGEMYPRPQDQVRWYLQLTGLMRCNNLRGAATQLYRNVVLPNLRNDAFDPVERFISANSWAALLIESLTSLDEAYDALELGNEAIPRSIDMVAIYERHVQAAKLFTLSGDVSLAEACVQCARSICVANGDNPALLVQVERDLDSR
jgi:hypothetical protein